MKTKSTLSILVMLVLLLSTFICFSSCKKTIDEEDFNIVGTWVDTKYPSSSSTYYTIVFKDNNKGSFNYYYNGKFEYSEVFDYSYSNGRALITWEGDHDYEVWNIEIYDSKTIMLSGDEEGAYYKQ